MYITSEADIGMTIQVKMKNAKEVLIHGGIAWLFSKGYIVYRIYNVQWFCLHFCIFVMNNGKEEKMSNVFFNCSFSV